jgi:branched-chain amino acid transport system permease protein
MAIGAYTMAILVVKSGVDMWLAALISIGVSILFALLVGLPTLRLRADYFAITTVAFSETIRYVALNEDRLTGGAQGTINLAGSGEAPSYSTQWNAFQGWVEGRLGVSKDTAMLVVVWTVAVLCILVMQVLVRSPWGRVLRAIREDEDAARSLGKNVFAYKLQSLSVGAVLGALAGLFYAWQFSFFSPEEFAPLLTFFGWTIVILGGTARNWAVPVGALVFGFVFAGTRFLDFRPLSYFDSAERAYLRLVIVGLILIGLMVFRPQGILGKREEMVLE